MKKCTKCQQEKELCKFTFRKFKIKGGFKDGYETICKDCIKVWRKTYQKEYRKKIRKQLLIDNPIPLEKYCDGCKLTKSIDNFYKDYSSKDKHQSKCISCARAYRYEHYIKNDDYYKARTKKAREIRCSEREKFKRNLTCQNCNESRWWVLEFHHRNPKDKNFNIGTMSTRKWSSMLEEIKKCDVLCANCHKDFHYQERLKNKGPDGY